MSILNAQFDENLILKVAKGDAAAFREIYDATRKTVYVFVLSVLKNRQDAEDITQETYIRLYKNANLYEPMGKPLAWLLTIARNLSFNKLSTSRQHDDIDENELPVIEKGHEDSENRILINAAINILDEEERRVVILHAIGGLKHREISDMYEVPLSTVLSKYNRALKKMKDELNRKGVDYYE